MNNPIPQTVSEEEKRILEFENRRVAAEGALVSASEAKRKLEADCEKMEEDLRIGREMAEKIKSDIYASNDKLLEIQNLVRAEDQKFEEKKKIHLLKLKEIEDEISICADKKIYQESELKALQKKHTQEKLVYQSEVADFESAKAGLMDETRKIDEEKAELVKKIGVISGELDAVKTEIKKKNEEKMTHESLISSLVNEVENQRGLIKNNSVIIENQNKEISEKEDQYNSWIAKIEKKTEEYKAIEGRAFTLLQKADILANKEAFIRNQYERAGITWEE